MFKELISVLEMIPDSKPKLSHLYTLSQSKLLENHINLHSGSYMYLLIAYMAVPPPPSRGNMYFCMCDIPIFRIQL